ncbi:MAG: zinc-ribbon domain-containing protein [Acidimicrobiia bacterium]|nr:zinc-ribbon domain-containing protein [Acidimicrobiia bacterium]
MASHKCEQCGATVAADEQFCPNCGAFLDPMSETSKPNVISVSSSGFETFELSEPPPDNEPPVKKSPRPASPTGRIQCPSCGAVNPSPNRHCEECGARLSQAPLPTAPRPAVQASAGVRAALAISGLLFGVVIIALIFNFATGDDTESTTTIAATTSTSQVVEENAPIPVISETCSIEGISSFVCANLTDGTDASYQVTWEDLTEDDTMTIRLTFDQPMVISSIVWTGLTDAERFKQNYRVRGLIVKADDSINPISRELEDTPGEQVIPFASVGANWVEFEITSVWNATVTNGNVFREIAIQEITVIGRPATTVTSTSSTSSTTTTAP